jgi:hypothetical protein
MLALVSSVQAAVTQLGFLSTPGANRNLTGVVAPAGSERVLIVTASHAGYRDVATVTYGGTPMTKAREHDDTVAVDSIWYLALGNSGSSSSATVAVTFANPATAADPADESFVSATVFSGVDQVVPIGTSNSRDATGIDVGSSLTIASATGDLVLDIFDGFRNVGAVTFAVSPGQTLVTSGSGGITGTTTGFAGYGVSTKPGAASVTTGWTSNSIAIIQIAVNIRAVPPPVTVATVGSVGQFGYFDLSTRQYTQIASNITGNQVTSLAYDGTSLYITDRTGGGTLLKSLSSSGGASASLGTILANGNLDEFIGLSFGNGTLYSTARGNERLTTINRTNAATTQPGVLNYPTGNTLSGKLAFVGSVLYGTIDTSEGRTGSIRSTFRMGRGLCWGMVGPRPLT